jgi:hypothetical protein
MNTRYIKIILGAILLISISIGLKAILVGNHLTKLSQLKNNSSTSGKTSPLVKFEILLKQLNIQTHLTPEGDYYVTTAFDVSHDELILVGNFNNTNLIKIFSLQENKLINEVDLYEDVPLDVYSLNNIIYILTDKSLVLLEDEKIIQKVEHNISDVFLFDRLLSLDNNLYLSMSDGSSYLLKNNVLTEQPYLFLDGQNIWVKKTSANSFLVSAKNRNISYNDLLTIGSMTVLGQKEDQLICVIEQIINEKPVKILRRVVSINDDFKKSINTFSQQAFSYLKNDIRIHQDKIYHLLLDSNSMILTSQTFQL